MDGRPDKVPKCGGERCLRRPDAAAIESGAVSDNTPMTVSRRLRPLCGSRTTNGGIGAKLHGLRDRSPSA